MHVQSESNSVPERQGNCPEIDGPTMSVPMAPEATLSGRREVFNNYEGPPHRQSKTQLYVNKIVIYQWSRACTVKAGNFIKINYLLCFVPCGFSLEPVITSLMDRSVKT
ncbi:hypothetical protein QLX08_001428 [Tetragonisca angustula]|uniref:Uncharacterized protein n=1 Tax=Tetragonisca angustula TaxID=166442 RepID=A0AAW1AHV1_9HYME